MSDIMQEFTHLNGLDHLQLLARRQQLLAATPDLRAMPDEHLQEMLAIARVLRKRAAAPAAKTSSRRAATPSLDTL